MSLKQVITLCVLLSVFLNQDVVQSARILGVIPLPSFSHQLWFRTLWKDLLNNGHELTLLTTDPMPEKHENLTQIDWHFTYKIKYDKYKYNEVMSNAKGMMELLGYLKVMFNEIMDEELSHPETKALLNDKNQTFDLLMVEYYLSPMFYFSKHFNCPYIGIASGELVSFHHDLLGNYVHPVMFPNGVAEVGGKSMTFKQRLFSTVLGRIFDINSMFNKELIVKHFGENMPSYNEIMQNASMVFANINPAFNLRPLGPATIPIGGGNALPKVKELPQDLKTFLDSAKNGVVYFSLGSSVKSTQLNASVVEAFTSAFKELPYKVLWKFDNDKLEGQPDNVKIIKWGPQRDILRHPNVKAFITQGGAQSLEEGTMSRVPLIGIPFYNDQKTNCKFIEVKGIGVQLDKNNLTKEIIKNAVLEVTQNPKYKENVKTVAELSEDQPMTGMERALWWTEYVLRHKGAAHFRSPIIDIPRYQFYLLDVYGFLIVVALILLTVIYFLLKLLFKLVFCIVRFVFRQINLETVSKKIN